MNHSATAVLLREARVDLDAIRFNLARFAGRHAPRAILADLSGDARGHGAVECATAAVSAGASWLGTSRITDAIAIRQAGLSVPILAWQHDPGETFVAAAASWITPALSTVASLRVAAASGIRSPHLVVDTGSGAPGFTMTEFAEACVVAAGLQSAGRLGSVGIMAGQGSELYSALAAAHAAGLRLGPVHGSEVGDAGPMTMVRTGAELFGLSDIAHRSTLDEGFRAAMTLRGPVIGTKAAAADTGVSYGYIYRTAAETTLALVSLGYGDGLDRAAGNTAPIWIGGEIRRIAGRVAMDALVVDVGAATVTVGDVAVLFGDRRRGVPSADDWADALGTTSSAITTRLTARVVRTYS